MVEEFLSQQGVAFEVRNIRENPVWMRELLDAGHRATLVTLVDGETVLGFNKPRLAELLNDR